MKRLPNQIPALGRNMVIHFTKDHDKLPLDILGAGKRVVLLAFAQCGTVNVRREIADCAGYARIKSAAVG